MFTFPGFSENGLEKSLRQIFLKYSKYVHLEEIKWCIFKSKQFRSKSVLTCFYVNGTVFLKIGNDEHFILKRAFTPNLV